ncbi:MAG: bacteriocin [Chitinophagales bacterium]
MSKKELSSIIGGSSFLF